MAFGRNDSPANDPADAAPAEVLAAGPDAVYVYVGRCGDGTRVARDSDGLLHAVVPLKQAG